MAKNKTQPNCASVEAFVNATNCWVLTYKFW